MASNWKLKKKKKKASGECYVWPVLILLTEHFFGQCKRKHREALVRPSTIPLHSSYVLNQAICLHGHSHCRITETCNNSGLKRGLEVSSPTFCSSQGEQGDHIRLAQGFVQVANIV